MDDPLPPPIRVLVVEDDDDDVVLTQALLADGFGGRCRVDCAQSYEAGLERLTSGNYDVALLDHDLGRETGIDLLRSAGALGCRTPVIMLTGNSNRSTDLSAMHAGAADFLVKGRVTPDMLERAIRYARERHRLLDEIRSLSLIDDLTGLHNRRAFFTLGEQRLQPLERRGSSCVLVFADVDGLKDVNDTLGHEAGDRLLIDAACALRATFRRTDLIGRLGGDEFVVLADDADGDQIERVLARLQTQIDTHNSQISGTRARLAMSAGALAFRASPTTRLQELVAEADTRMLEVKRGRKGSARRISAPEHVAV